ncbi:hypothetical protein DPMN_112792 [Dreissena polymorpha]|uniref:Uncharacterized protein n=1 Tax=Dreissena polymorpha TaxID=45954 RepID=A0A9D4KGD5_DREPO|nr:hypothetical protein DPMN_112792 [Dreissena polymorpha]
MQYGLGKRPQQRTCDSADTANSLVSCKKMLQPKKVHQFRPYGKSRVDVSKTAFAVKVV